MRVSRKQRYRQKGVTYHWVELDGLRAFHEFVDTVSASLDAHHKRILEVIHRMTQDELSEGSDWYGQPVPTSIDELNEHDHFLRMDLLEAIQPKIAQYLSKYLGYTALHMLPQPKIRYNDRGLGVFSFDRAAMALYHTGAGAGTNGSKSPRPRPIDHTVSKLSIELAKNLRTRVKKVYAYFEHKDTSYPSIRLYLMAGGNANVEGDQLLYVGLACAELVDFLEARGVAVEVNVLYGSSFDGQVILGVVRVKRFQDRLDKNRLLLLSSDPRYFRYRGFKSVIALSQHFGLQIHEGLGRITPDLGKELVAILEGQDQVQNDSKEAQRPGRFVFEQSYSLDGAASEVKRILNTLTQTNSKQDV